MNKAMFVALCTLTASVQAAPHLYGNVQDEVTHCGMVLDGAPKVTAPVIAGTPKQCKFDLAGVSNGQHTATLTAIIIDPVWGNQESAPSAPFVFLRPAAPTVPAAVKLAP